MVSLQWISSRTQKSCGLVNGKSSSHLELFMEVMSNFQVIFPPLSASGGWGGKGSEEKL